MRVSAGCLVIALSGNTRTQSFPPFFMWRPMATREASIWRAVTHFGSSAFKAYSPKAMLVPRLAGPLMRGWLCGLRYLTLLGINMTVILLRLGRLGSRSGRSGLRGLDARGRDDRGRGRVRLGQLHELLGALDEKLLLEDPALHADETGRGERLGVAVVDVGAEGVQRHAAFTGPLAARDLGAVEAAADHDLDAESSGLHRALHGAAHGAAVRDALLELHGHGLGDEPGVELGILDLHDVDEGLASGEILDLAADGLDVGALLADDDAGAGGVDVHAQIRARALDAHPADGGLLEGALDQAADLEVLADERRHVPLREPLGFPVVDVAQANGIRMDFIAHVISSRCSARRRRRPSDGTPCA